MKLPKVESLIILAFFGIVALWAVSKCSSKRGEISRRVHDIAGDEEDRPVKRDTIVIKAPPPVQTQQPVNTQTPATTPAPAASVPGVKPERPVLGNPATPVTTTQAAAPPQAAPPKYSTLFVTIDGLKLRKEPSLKGAVVTKLELYEPVFFLNQKTEKTEEISLGLEKVTDHWVKIRTKSGKEGWVFGAGVHYYKMKRKGVM